MANIQLPLHPSMLHPLTGEPIRAIGLVGTRPVWPCMGAAPDDGGGDGGDGGTGGDAGGTGGAGADGGTGKKTAEPGFPANTPWEQMTVEQQAAYWKHQSQKHEKLHKALGELTPDELAEIRDKASRHDALELELMSDKDKAAEDAAKKTKADTEGKYRPMVVKSYFQGWAAANNVDADRLTAILEPLDLTKFLTRSGDIDTARVSTYLAQFTPARGNQLAGPTVFGLGQHSAPPSTPGEQGRAQLERRGYGKQAAK